MLGVHWSSVLAILYIRINDGSEGISDVVIKGPEVLENGRQQFVDLSCSFNFIQTEYKQLDIKWYFDNQEEPFLQWVPSSGRKPQTIGPRFRSRVSTSYNLRNGSLDGGYLVEQVVRVDKPSIHTGGIYTCKVATFTTEQLSSHNLLIFDAGAGPFLSYNSDPSSPDKISVTCAVKQVFPEPKLSLSCYSEPEYRDMAGSEVASDTSTTTVRRGMSYDVSVHASLASNLPHQTVFSCFMQIPGTQYSLVKKTMYNGDNDVARARRVSAAHNKDPFLTLITTLILCLAVTLL